MCDLQDLPDPEEVSTRLDRLPSLDRTGGSPDEEPPLSDRGAERLRAAVASGMAARIPLSVGVPDHATAKQQANAGQLAELFGRRLTPDEVAIAVAMLAGPMSWAADPSLHRVFVTTEFHAWTTARAGGDITSNPYGPEHLEQLGTVWAAAFARAQAFDARARQAAAPTSISRKIRFWSAKDGTTFGTVTLTSAAELEYSNDAVRGILRARMAMIGPERAFLSYTDWSNGYVCSSEV